MRDKATIEEAYDELIDCGPDVIIGNMSYAPSRVLKLVDPIAYQCGLNDWLDSLAQDGLYCFECEAAYGADLTWFLEDVCQCGEEE